MKILAAVVTHNRCELLSRCLDHILAQSRPADAVLVIDNASGDGTVAMLKKRGIDFITQDNTGSAGGWHRAIAHGEAEGFDAVWLMDDDGFPDARALQALEPALAPDVACASSIVLREDQPGYFVFPFPRLDSAGLPRIVGRGRKIPTLRELEAEAADGTYPFVHLFNGALISLQATRQVGNVNRDWFMSGDEVDYFFRLRRAGRVLSVLRAVHHHPDVTQRPFTPAKVYYYLKNTLILNRLYFNRVWLRHLLATAAVLARAARRNGPGLALSLLGGRQAPVLYSAIARGLSGRIGKDFDV